MTDTLKKYLAAVKRRLNLPKEVRQRVMTDFASSLQGRLEAGQSEEEILAELGSPKKAAAELNEQMKEFAFRKSFWRWPCLGAGILSLIVFLTRGIPLAVISFPLRQGGSIGIIGGADGPTSILVTSSYPLNPWYGLLWLIPVVLGFAGFLLLRRLRRK